MLFLVTGASGSGKSACLSRLQSRLPEIDWRDFDDLPSIPANTAERQIATEHWLQLAAENAQKNISTGIAGTVILGEVLACPSATKLSSVHAVLLDCHDVVRIDRIRARDADPVWASQEMLSWAAWQRMHAVDPQWRQDVIQTPGAPGMQWERWRDWRRGDRRWQVETIDTTALTIDNVVEKLAEWILRKSLTC
jgi:hypothetical protein